MAGLDIDRAADARLGCGELAGHTADAGPDLFRASGGDLAGPGGIGHQRAAEGDQVGGAGGQQLLGGLRAEDATGRDDGHGGTDGGADADGEAGERGLANAGAERDVLARLRCAGGDVDGGGAGSDGGTGDLLPPRHVVAAFDQLGGADTDDDGEVFAGGAADGRQRVAEQAQATGRAAAEAIPALVGDAREELVNEIAVPGLKLYAVEAGGAGAGSRSAKGRDQALDLGAGEGADGAAVGQGGWRGAD